MTVTENAVATADAGTLLERVEDLEKRLAELEETQPDDRVSMVVCSGDLDRVLAGFVLATGSITFRLVHNPQFFITRAIASLSTNSAVHDDDNRSVVELPNHGNAGFAGAYRQSISTSAVFPVSAGSNTIFLVGEIDAGGTGLNHIAADASLTLAFFPTAYGTVSSTTLSGRGQVSDDGLSSR